MLKEFREFAMRGNVVDLAVGVIIGAAFGKIVSSLVDAVIMPLLGLVMGKVDFRSLYWALDGKTYETLAAAEAAKAPLLKYGLFVQNVVDFFIVAFVIFLIVKGLQSLKKKEPAAPAATPAPTGEEVLLTEIRDLLRSQSSRQT
jgi:large conductance mechanosensitive channel